MYKVLKTCKFAFEPWEKQLSLTKDEAINLPEKKAEILLRYNYIEKIAEEANAKETNAETKVLDQGENKKIKLTYKKRNKS